MLISLAKDDAIEKSLLFPSLSEVTSHARYMYSNRNRSRRNDKSKITVTNTVFLSIFD